MDVATEVDTVQDRAGQPVAVTYYFVRQAMTGRVAGGAVVTARTGVGCRYQDEAGRVIGCFLGAGDADNPVFQGLAQGLKRLPLELRQFVEEKHAAVGQADLTGPQPGAAADDCRVAGAMVRRPERPLGYQLFIIVSGQAVQMSYLQDFFAVQGR